MFPNKYKQQAFFAFFALLLAVMTTTTMTTAEFIMCKADDGSDTGYCQSPKGICTKINEGDDKEVCVCAKGRSGPPNCDGKVDECSLSVEEGYPCNGFLGKKDTKSTFCVNEELPLMYKCGCKDGWVAILPDADSLPDGIPAEYRPTSCADIDECVTENNICGSDATCNNLPGSYECICNDPTLIYVNDECVGQPSTAPSPMPSSSPSISFVPTAARMGKANLATSSASQHFASLFLTILNFSLFMGGLVSLLS